MELIGQGRTNKDIVRLLGLSPNTVKSYIRTAYRRLEVESRSEAVLWVNGVEVERS
jgi:DNA-binding CsgD family transcriptional regulator